MSTLSTTNIKHPSSGSNNLVLTSGGATQIAGLTYPTADGSNGQYLRTNGSGALSFATVTDTTGWTWDTTGTSLSGSSTVSVTGIPSTTKQIIVGIRDLSVVNDINWLFRVGTSSGLATTNYNTFGYFLTTSNGNDLSSFTNGWQTFGGAANSFLFNGTIVLTKLVSNVWYATLNSTLETTHSNICNFQGHVELSGTLDRVGILPATGNFDSGSIYVSYLQP